MQRELSEAQIRSVIKNHEFDESIIGSNKNVAIVMTQSWCWQWRMAKEWIASVSDISELDIYTVVYDNKGFYEDFLDFKENIFGNYEIPYIRYYIDGKLIGESNYVPKDSFLETFQINLNK